MKKDRMREIGLIGKLLIRRKTAVLCVFSFLLAELLFLLLQPDSAIAVRQIQRYLGVNFLTVPFTAFLVYDVASSLMEKARYEALLVIPGAKKRLLSVVGLLSGAVLGACCLLQLFFCLSAALHDNLFGLRLLLQLLAAVLLYAVLPGILGAVIGAVYAGDPPQLAVPSLLLWSVLFAPTTLKTLENTPVGLYTRFRDWIRIFGPDLSYLCDAGYGIPVEPVRFALVLFWIGIFVLLGTRKELRKPAYRAIWILALGATLLCGAVFFHRDDSFLLDPEPDWGNNGRESRYYEDYAVSVEALSPEIASLKLQISAHSKLRTEAEIGFAEALTAGEAYCLTLHHGLKVQQIQTGDGNPVAYAREGDVLVLRPDRDIAAVTICYEGNCGRYYANRQGIFLPSYVAWYPVAGLHSLWNSEYDCPEPLTLQNTMAVSLTVNSGLPLFSNLETKDGTNWSGECAGPTLMGGFLSASEKGGRSCIDAVGDTRLEAFDWDRFEAVYTAVTERLKRSGETGLPESLKHVFVTPHDLRDRRESVVRQGDQLFYAVRGYDYRDYMTLSVQSLLAEIPANRKTDTLKRLLEAYLSGEEGKGQIPELTDLEILETYYNTGEYPDRITLLRGQEALEDLFWYCVLSVEKSADAIYSFLVDYNGTDNPVEYMIHLGGLR